VVEEFLGGSVVVDALECQQGQKALLEGAEPTLDLAFGLGTRSHEMGDSQRRERALELRTGIAAVGRGLVSEKCQSIGVEGHGAAVAHEGPAEVFEMMPGGVGWDERGTQILAGMVVDGQQQGLLGVRSPPRVDGGVVLPEFADTGALPTPSGFGNGKRRQDEIREVGARVRGDGFAVPVEGEAVSELVGDELEIWGALEGQEGLKEASDLRRPALVVIATRDAWGEAWSVVEPCEADPEELSPTDAENFAGGGSIESPVMKRLDGLAYEFRGQALGELLLLFRKLSGSLAAAVARHFVGPRYAQASSCLATAAVPLRQSHFELPPVSFCSHPDTSRTLNVPRRVHLEPEFVMCVGRLPSGGDVKTPDM